MEIAVAFIAVVAFIGFVAYKITRKVERERPAVPGVGGGRPSPDVQTHEK